MAKTYTASGVIVPLLTPMDDNGERIDEGAMRMLAEWLIGKGVHGLMPCGTTGEGPLLTTAERKRLLEIVVDVAKQRVPVIAHVGAITTRETIELAQHAQSLKVAAISVVTPYYFPFSQDAIAEHFCRVADAVRDMQVYLYNIPSRTINVISRECVEKVIARCPNVVGIKDSMGDLEHLKGYVGLRGGKFQVTCGSDALISKALKVGAIASISGNANIYPEVMVKMFEAYGKGDWDGVQRQQQTLDTIRALLEDGRNLALYKKVLDIRGLKGGLVRPPMPQADPALVEKVRAELQNLKI